MFVGNILMVGFYDILSVFMVGYKVCVKFFFKDVFIMFYFFKILGEWDERVIFYFKV